jgi:release factor glutamine methyltransferase
MPEHITTIKSALHWAYTALKDTSESYVMDARILLSEVLKVKQDYLMRYPDRVLTHQETSNFQNWIIERAKGTPIAYLLGRQAFYDIEVEVTPDVLIPRPETELLVEKAIAWARNSHTFVVDVGTGSGVIALAVAKHLPNAHITGIELSEAALKLAQRNSDKLGLSQRIRWLHGDLLKPLIQRGETADLVLANLPYVASEEMSQLEVSKHEPHLALDGGPEGLEVIRNFLTDAPSVLREKGLLLMEIGASQGEAVKSMAEATFPSRKVAITPDLAGHDRIVSVE